MTGLPLRPRFGACWAGAASGSARRGAGVSVAAWSDVAASAASSFGADCGARAFGTPVSVADDAVAAGVTPGWAPVGSPSPLVAAAALGRTRPSAGAVALAAGAAPSTGMVSVLPGVADAALAPAGAALEPAAGATPLPAGVALVVPTADATPSPDGVAPVAPDGVALAVADERAVSRRPPPAATPGRDDRSATA